MPSYTSTLAMALIGATTAFAQSSSDIPLASKHFDYTSLPYMVDTNNGPRGIQTGYNLCNSTTEGSSSLCQTAIVNSLDDFCIWGPQKPDSQIADTEGELVAWCTKPGHPRHPHHPPRRAYRRAIHADPGLSPGHGKD